MLLSQRASHGASSARTDDGLITRCLPAVPAVRTAAAAADRLNWPVNLARFLPTRPDPARRDQTHAHQAEARAHDGVLGNGLSFKLAALECCSGSSGQSAGTRALGHGGATTTTTTTTPATLALLLCPAQPCAPRRDPPTQPPHQRGPQQLYRRK